MPNTIRTAKEIALQEMLDKYNEISRIGVMDFSDYYDSRMDGVEAEYLGQSPELDDYVDKLLSFQKEEDAGELEDEEKEVFKKLKSMLRSESKETGIHKLLQFKLMNALLNADGDIESEHIQTAASCQKLYDKIASYQIIETNLKKQAMQDDGSLNKSPRKIAKEILTKEALLNEAGTLKRKPLQRICDAMLKDFQKYKENILTSPALFPYQTLINENLKAKKRGEMEEATAKVMTPELKEKLRINQEIEKKRTMQKKLQQEFDRTNELFKEDYEKAKEKGIVLTIPKKDHPETRVFIKTSKIREQQEQEKNALNEIFHNVIDDFVQCVDDVKATDKGPTSDAFRKMMESLTMLRNHKDTLKNLGEHTNSGKYTKSRNRALVDTIAQAYKDTTEYIKKRENDGFFSRHLGQGGTRYKQAKAIRDLLKTYHDTAEQLELHRIKDVLLMRQEKKDELKKEISKIDKEINELTDKHVGKQKRENLERNGKVKQKSADSRQRLEKGVKELENTSKTGKKHNSDSKKTTGKAKSNGSKSSSLKTTEPAKKAKVKKK